LLYVKAKVQNVYIKNVLRVKTTDYDDYSI